MSRVRILAFTLGVGACAEPMDTGRDTLSEDSGTDTAEPELDGDADGFSSGEDCDDTDADVHPGASESCGDGVDSDCAGGDCAEGDRPLDSAGVRYDGEGSGYSSGNAVAGLGDVDADGYDDWIVGSMHRWEDGINGGGAYLVRGSASPRGMSLGEADAVFWGVTQGEDAGRAVAGAGDVNADGFPDLLVGAPTKARATGSVYLVLGGESLASRSLAEADVEWTGRGREDGAGGAVSGVGDVNGDGVSDVLIGSPYADRGGKSSGAADLILGGALTGGSLDAADASFRGEAAFDYAGQAVAGAGDVDGDGYTDFLVGAAGTERSAGTAYLVRGGAEPWSGSLGDAQAGVFGVAEYEDVGRAVASAGDVDADGFTDLLVGTPGVGAAGGAVLVYGSAAPAFVPSDEADVVFLGRAATDQAGTSVACTGDIDGDGHPELLLGAPGVGLFSGAAWLFRGSGRPVSSEAYAGLFAVEGSDLAGSAVAGVGDVDGDGYGDFVVGAPGQSSAAPGAGAVWLLLGAAAR